MFFNQQTCEHISKVLTSESGYQVAIGLLFSWVIAILLGDLFVKNLIKNLQKAAKGILDSSKKKCPTPLKEEWGYWVKDVGLGKYNAWLGAFEITFFYICILVNKPEGIGAWLVFKVAAKWESWTNIVNFPKKPRVLNKKKNKFNVIDDFEYLRLRNDLATSVLQKFLIGTILNILIAFIGVTIFSVIRILLIIEKSMQESLPVWRMGIIGIVIVLICIRILEFCIVVWGETLKKQFISCLSEINKLLRKEIRI